MDLKRVKAADEAEIKKELRYLEWVHLSATGREFYGLKLRTQLFFTSLITIKEELQGSTRKQLEVKFKVLQSHHFKLRYRTLEYVMVNIKELMEWSKDEWLDSLILEVQHLLQDAW